MEDVSMELFYRFLFGGILVCCFSVLSDTFKPKSFSGVFGGAPSIAIAGLALTWWLEGSREVGNQARAMFFGAIAMFIYSIACMILIRKTKLPAWVGAGVLWSVWLMAAFGFYLAGLT